MMILVAYVFVVFIADFKYSILKRKSN